MEYIVSRNYVIDQEVLKTNIFYQIWKNKLFPYKDLKIGDIIYWYDRQTNKINYKVKVIKLHKFEYKTRQELKNNIYNFFKRIQGEDYLKVKASKGVGICFRVEVIKKVNFYRPSGIHLPQLGWLKVDNEIKESWLNPEQFKIADESVLNRLANKDLVKKLKERVGYKCQFPKCGVRVKTKNGYYTEVAHIVAVRDGGSTAEGNLVVLCPNHHKEFDYGELIIIKSSKQIISGILNGKKFAIKLWMKSKK